MTLDDIKARCEEEGECWHWKHYGGVNGNYPQARIGGKWHNVRRMTWEAANGPIRKGLRIVPCCGNRRCINPDHMKALTESQKSKLAAKRGAFSSPVRGAAISRAQRGKRSKLTDACAADIRASIEPAPVLAERYGVSTSLVHSIRRGNRWREYTASPFAGLGALLRTP